MKCSTCGKENPEGQKFCGDCGAMIPQPPPPPVQPTQPSPTQPTESWYQSNQRKVWAIVIVLVVILAIALSFFVLPMQGIRVGIHSHGDWSYTISIDGKEKGTVDIPSGSGARLAYPVAVGSHLVAIDWGLVGHWSMEVFVTPFSMQQVVADVG